MMMNKNLKLVFHFPVIFKITKLGSRAILLFPHLVKKLGKFYLKFAISIRAVLRLAPTKA
jgi:hypothetical protein